MIIIKHRINSAKDLETLPCQYGIECDVRYHDDDLILTHDPFNHHLDSHTTLQQLCQQWKHQGPLILNLKTEGIEYHCIEMMSHYKIDQWFFLDMSMPFFVKYANLAEQHSIANFSANNLGVRFSEFEPIEYALAFKNKVHWVWVDCFTICPLNQEIVKTFSDNNFKICVVSPELQSHSIERINEFKKQLTGLNITAVCTKFPEKWID